MRRGASIIAIAAAALAIPSAAAASWQATGSGSGYSQADSLWSGNTPATSVSGRNVTVNWTATSGTVPVTGYVVKRYDASSGVQQTIGSGCSGTIAATSCTEAAVPPGSWKYAVTPARQNWRGTQSAKSSSTTVGSPSLSLTTSTITCRPGTLSGTITNFITGDSVTFHLDSPTGTTLSGSTTPSTIPNNGQASVSITIPTTVTGGSHTVYVVDSGDTATSPSASFTVDALRVATGTYTGNGTSQTITGLGFQPDAVIDKAATNSGGAVMSTTTMGTNATKPLAGATAPSTGMITSLPPPPNGFSVGSNAADPGARGPGSCPAANGSGTRAGPSPPCIQTKTAGSFPQSTVLDIRQIDLELVGAFGAVHDPHRLAVRVHALVEALEVVEVRCVQRLDHLRRDLRELADPRHRAREQQDREVRLVAAHLRVPKRLDLVACGREAHRALGVHATRLVGETARKGERDLGSHLCSAPDSGSRPSRCRPAGRPGRPW